MSSGYWNYDGAFQHRSKFVSRMDPPSFDDGKLFEVTENCPIENKQHCNLKWMFDTSNSLSYKICGV